MQNLGSIYVSTVRNTLGPLKSAGRRALGAWLNRCRVEVGNVKIGTFKKLMSALVDSTMPYVFDNSSIIVHEIVYMHTY